MIVPSGCPHEVASLVLHGAVTPNFLNIEVFQKIKEFDEIEFIAPILITQIPNIEKEKIDLVYGIEMSNIKQIKPQWKIDGTIPFSDDSILLGYDVAEHYSIKKGDILTYENKRFTVSGIVQKTSSQDDAFVYMPLKALQDIIKKPNGATAIGVKVKDVDKLNTVIEEISLKIPGIQIVTMSQVVNSLANLAGSAKILSLSIALVAILISAIGVMNSILMAIFERTEEIGLMRAIGASKFDIFRIIIKETVLLTLTGGLIGLIMSLVGANIIEGFVRNFMPYIPSGKMIQFDPFLALICLFFSIFLGIFAGIFPAWRATKINPIKAIRG
ncbi:ABC transporter permease protein [Thermodesulfovibrio sp. N1]|nr:ABC transporter permease protein [Thermodesulfovibrio sp. N1]